MKVLYYSVAPWVNSGYGRCTREIATHLHNNGHEVAIQPLAAVKKGEVLWHGDNIDKELESPMKIYPAESKFGLGDVESNYDKFDADMLFTHFDTWMEGARRKIPSMGVPYASYVIVDHDPVPEAVVTQVLNSHRTIAMSEWAQAQLGGKGVLSDQIPHGVHTDRYYPIEEETPTDIDVEDENGDTRRVSLDDTFMFGMVAANHGSRKRIPAQMEAFSMFLKEVDEDAMMYIHTDQNAKEGFNLEEVRKEIGVPKRNLIWPSPQSYQELDDATLNQWYNTFDVMLNCSMGESWGMTVTEAQSAGVPCIVTDFSSMPEQLGADPEQLEYRNHEDPGVKEYPHGLAVKPRSSMYMQKVSARQYLSHPRDIADAMERYYRDDELREEHGEKAREYVMQNYDWEEQVLPQFLEMFNNLEKEIV